MTEDLVKKLNTAGAFDSPWYREQLCSWDVVREQQKADFQEHLYTVYQPGNHCYTGLWERFCITEAGPICRDKYFEMVAAVEEYERLHTLQKV
jgi:hypothetical protein